MPKKILVIDDDKLILMTLKRLLRREGYKVTTAMNGQTAFRHMEEEGDFDLIISDIKMPQMDGIETVKKIREFLSQHNKPLIPELFITGYAKEDIYKKALELHAAGYIEKPFDLKELLTNIEKNIKR